MTPSNALRLLSLIGLSSLFMNTAHAQDEAYYYGGLSIGQSRGNFDQNGLSSRMLPPGVTTTSVTSDERDTAYKAFLGYQFNPYVGLEGGYFNLGEFDLSAATAPPGTLNGNLKLQGLNLDLVGTMPLGMNWSVIGRIGAQHAQARGRFSGTGAASTIASSRDENDTNYKFGLGLQYEINPSWLVRVEAERYRISDTTGGHGNVDLYSLSLVFPFGRTSTPPPRMAQAPTYVTPEPAPAPAPAPVVQAPAVVPMAAPPQRVSLSAESLFGFDRAVLRPEGKAELDTLASSLSGTQYTEVIVEGHTDRLGSDAYNQSLSEQRAQSVKAYLISSGRLDAAKVSAIGKGESTPVTQAMDCRGTKRTAALVSCLQPDRRVEIRVNATR